MASVPLTLDTLQQQQSPTESPLMSPHKAMAVAISSPGLQASERPSHLTLDGQQQHSNMSPSSSSLSAHGGNISPGLSSAGSLSPSFLPEMPQWKRDLIQRRKQNVQRTINASSPNATNAATAITSPLSSPSAAAAAATPPMAHGLKTSTSSSSMRSLAGSNTNIDQVASDGIPYSPTKEFNKLSSATAKVNKHHAKPATATGMPATIKPTLATTAASSPNKEKSEKLFGGQYTATTTAAAAAAEASAKTTVNTKEEITKDHHHHQQHHHYQQRHTMEEEYLDKSKKTKEYHSTTAVTSTATATSTAAATRTIKTQHEEEEQPKNHQEEEQDARHITTTIKPQQQQHQVATCLTGSSSSSLLSSSSSHLTSYNTVSNTTTTTSSLLNKTTARESISSSPSSSFSAEREQQYAGFSITGANSGSSIQSSSKCESERLACAANIAGSNTSTSTTTVKISQKLQQNQFIKNEKQQKTKIIKFKSSSTTTDLLKSPTKIATTSSFSPSSSSTSITNNCLINSSNSNSHNNIKKMVAMQEMKKSSQNSANSHLHSTNGRSNRTGGVGVSSQNSNDLDSNEDLSYGPGIVSKLRCRYLSLALRESMEQQRLNKDQLRRSTSLNNLLDDDCVDHGDEDEDNETLGEEEDMGETQKISENLIQKKSGILKTSCTTSSSSSSQEKRFTQGSNGVGVTFTETSFNKRSRHLKRGNDSLKRARSVEALLSEKSPWQPAGNRNSATTPTCVTIEDKIHNARERLQQGTDHLPPKRLTSIIDDTERPPPDLVKQTLKMFEASANRRPRCTNRSNSKGDVASKVETFKNIIKEQKPVVTYPKPSSPTKKLNTQPLVKPLNSTTQASDLLQTPLGRKTMAVASCNSSNILSDNTPDIIPRQKLHTEREMVKEKFTGINKEKFMNSLMEPPLSTTNVVDSPLKSNMKEKFLGSMVDSPVTALTKQLEKLNFSDIDNAANRKGDSFARNGCGGGGVGGGVGGVDSTDDALHDNDQYNSKNEGVNTNEFSSSLKSETDKISETPVNSNAAATAISTTLYEATVKAHTAPSSSDLSDGEDDDDDEYGISTTKRITRSALDNIAKAGTTQQFKFSATTSSSHHHTSASVGGKQVGVIRPLLNTSSTASNTSSSTATHNKLVTAAESNMETLKQHSSPSSLTSREIEKNRINDLKKSSTSSSPSHHPTSSAAGPSATSSPSTASLDNVIKSSTAASAAYSDVDTVISATNSPLWAMRQRRQKPPAQPAENTSMVFNFSNRKEVPDYIENDGVIFRRKRELPKPNESGFVLLGDLSVETSTDMDYDDFSMCPPSPCDVEFVNANIVIDGKSSIRQKSKDATFRVQFNDTLTSTFEYPSEASLVVEDSFADYAESEFNQALQNLVLESYASSSSHRVEDDDDDDSNAIIPSVHHVADEIIQLPTTTNESSSSSPANQQTTKNILGNLPLDCPDLGKATPLTVVAANTDNNNSQTTQENNNNNNVTTQNILNINTNNSNILNNNSSSNTTTTHSKGLPQSLATRKSRKDLKLPLLEQLQQHPLPPTRLPKPKPQLPEKRCQIIANDLNIRAPTQPKVMVVQQHLEPVPQQQQSKEEQAKINDSNGNCSNVTTDVITDKLSEFDLEKQLAPKPRKVSHVLNKPQYACFLQQSSDVKQKMPVYLTPVQRSRSNEFQRKYYGSNIVNTTTVFRSNSLRNIEKPCSSTSTFTLPRRGIDTSTPTLTTTSSTTSVISSSLYFTPDVNLPGNLTKPDANILCTVDAKKSKSLNNLTSDLTENQTLPDDCKLTENVNFNVYAMEGNDENAEIIKVTDSCTHEVSNLIDNSVTVTNDNTKERQVSNYSADVTESVNHCSHNIEDGIQRQHRISFPTTDTLTETPSFDVKQQISYSTANLTECCNNILENTTLSLPNLTEISNDIKDLPNYLTDSTAVNNDFSDYSVKITEPTTLSLPNLARNITTAYEQISPIHISYLNTNLTEYTVNITEKMTLSLPNLNQTPSYSTDILTDGNYETVNRKDKDLLLTDLECKEVLTYNPNNMTDTTETIKYVNQSKDYLSNVNIKQNVNNLNRQQQTLTDTFDSVEIDITENVKNLNRQQQTLTDTFDSVEVNIAEPFHCKTDSTVSANGSNTVDYSITKTWSENLTESLPNLSEHSLNIIDKNGNVKINNSVEILSDSPPVSVHLRERPTLSLQLSVDSLDEYKDALIEPVGFEDNDQEFRNMSQDETDFNQKCCGINENFDENCKSSSEIANFDEYPHSYDMIINELAENSENFKTTMIDNVIEYSAEAPNSQVDFSLKSIAVETSNTSLEFAKKSLDSNKHLPIQNDSENKKISLDISNNLKDSNNPQNPIKTLFKCDIAERKEISKDSAKTPLDNETQLHQKSKFLHKTGPKSHKIYDITTTEKPTVNLANLTLKNVGGLVRSSYRENSPEISTKSPRFPPLKPTTRLSHLLDTTPKDVATFLYVRANSGEPSRKSGTDLVEIKPINMAATTGSIMRSGRKCNRSISSSFRQALTLYESFNETSKDTISGEVKNIGTLQRSKSLIENSKKGQFKVSSNNNITEMSQNMQMETKPDVGCAHESPYYSLSENSLEYYDTLPLDDNGNANNNISITPEANCETKTVDSGLSLDIKPSSPTFFNTSPRPFRKLCDPKENKESQKSSFLVLTSHNVDNASLDLSEHHRISSSDSPLLCKSSSLLPLEFITLPSGSSLKSFKTTTKPSVPQKPNLTINLANTVTNSTSTNMYESINFEPTISSSSSCPTLTNPSFSKILTDHEISSNLLSNSVLIDSNIIHSATSATSSYKLPSTAISKPITSATSNPSFFNFVNERPNNLITSNAASSDICVNSASAFRKPREPSNFRNSASTLENQAHEIDFMKTSSSDFKPTNSSLKFIPAASPSIFTSSNTSTYLSTSSFGNFHVDDANTQDLPVNLNLYPQKLLKSHKNTTSLANPTTGFKISTTDSQTFPISHLSTASELPHSASSLESTQNLSNRTADFPSGFNSPSQGTFVSYSSHSYPGTISTFAKKSMDVRSSTHSIASPILTVANRIPHALNTLCAETKPKLVDSKTHDNTHTFALPIHMGTEHPTTKLTLLHTLPVKVTSTSSVTRKNNNNAFSFATNNHEHHHQVKGKGEFNTSKPVEFLKTTNSCSSTFSSTSLSSSSTPYSTITTTTSTTTTSNKVHATSKRMPQRDVLRSATPPKVMPRRIFATSPLLPSQSAPSQKTKTISKNTAITTGGTTIKTMTATSITSNSSSSSSPSCTTSNAKNNLKASSASSYKSANNTTITTSSALCAPPLRRRIPGNTLYYV